MNDIAAVLLSEGEVQQLNELREVLSAASSPGFMRIMTRLDEAVQEAREAELAAFAAPDTVLAALSRRWQQRESIVRDIRDYVSSCEQQKKVILDGLTRESSSDAEQG